MSLLAWIGEKASIFIWQSPISCQVILWQWLILRISRQWWQEAREQPGKAKRQIGNQLIKTLI